jgi:hypothetical protein
MRPDTRCPGGINDAQSGISSLHDAGYKGIVSKEVVAVHGVSSTIALAGISGCEDSDPVFTAMVAPAVPWAFNTGKSMMHSFSSQTAFCTTYDHKLVLTAYRHFILNCEFFCTNIG